MEPVAIERDVHVTTREQRSGRVLVIASRLHGVSLPDMDGLGCDMFQVASGPAALNAVRYTQWDLALLYPEAVSGDGLELVPRLLAEQPGLDVVVVTASATL